MSGIFSVKKFNLAYRDPKDGVLHQPNCLAILAENAFRPLNVDKGKIESALRDLFKGATDVTPRMDMPAGYSSNGSRIIVWSEIDNLELESAEHALFMNVAGLNAIYSYQRR